MKLLRIAAAAISLFGPTNAVAQEPPAIAYETFSLDNGLRVILAPSQTTQVVAIDVTYAVGSADEVKGRTGFAHLFEHMMFQGSANIPKGGHFQFVGDAGGMTNAFTTDDRTEYFQVLPSNLLARGLWLEADRMRSLAVTDANFENQRSTVQEEVRMNVLDKPFIPAVLAAVTGTSDSTDCFSYAHSTFGSMEDLSAASADDARAFFAKYYRPNNATLVIAGDFEPAQATKLIRQYFSDIPAGEKPATPACRIQFDSGERRRRVTDPKAPLPATFAAFRIPAFTHQDYPAVAVMSDILGGTTGSRIQQSLVRGRQIALFAGTQLGASISGATGRSVPRRNAAVLIIQAIGTAATNPDTLEEAVVAEVAKLVRQGVTAEELETAKQQYRARVITARQIPLFVAEDLQVATRFHGDPAAANTEAQRYLNVTAADVNRVAARYLKLENSLIITAVPEVKK